MTDILSLPTAGPVAPALVGVPILLDGALPSTPPLTADPFAAFLATAQATPVPATAQPAVILPFKLPVVATAEGNAPEEEIEAKPSDGDGGQPENDSKMSVLVDPTLSPALAMLSALATAEPKTPRIAPDTPKSRPVIAPTPLPQAPTATIVAPVATQPPASPAAALQMVASARPALPTTDAPATAAAASVVIAAPPVATLEVPAMRPADAPVADRPVVTTSQPVSAFPTPAQTVVVPTASAPVPAELVEGAVAASTTVPLTIKDAVADDTSAPPETEIAVAAEVTLPPRTRAASSIKPRAIASRADGDAAPARERSERPLPATPALRVPATVARDTVRAEPIPAASVAAPIEMPSSALAQAPVADLLVQRQLVIAEDGRWLDSLARDIAHSASGETMQFRLEPVNLGGLTVSIAQGSDGTAIRMTAETHHARDILIEAQPALIAEARANGLRISETHVDLNSANRDGSNASGSPGGGQPSFTNNSAGQQAMRQDGNSRRQPDLPGPLPDRPRSADADAPARDSGERFA